MAESPDQPRRKAPMQVRVPDAMRAEFEAMAKRRGVLASVCIRELMAAELRRDAGVGDVPIARPRSADDLKRERLTLRLPAYVVRVAEARAAESRRPLAAWLADLVQSNVTGTPVVDDLARRDLGAAIRELAAIGRNINQIARALNEAHFRTEQVKLQRLDELRGGITRLRLAVRAVLDMSMNSWRGES